MTGPRMSGPGRDVLARCDCPRAEEFLIRTDSTLATVNEGQPGRGRPRYKCPACGERTTCTTAYDRRCVEPKCDRVLSRYTDGPRCNQCERARSDAWVKACVDAQAARR